MRKKQISKEKKQSIIEGIASRLREQKHITFAYIFGSFAQEEKFSDIDIGVFVSEEIGAESLNFEFDLEEEIKPFTNLPVDVRIINHAPLSFVYHVIKEGILIVDKDAGKRADFEGIIFKKYLDFAFFRRQYLKEVPNAPI